MCNGLAMDVNPSGGWWCAAKEEGAVTLGVLLLCTYAVCGESPQRVDASESASSDTRRARAPPTPPARCCGVPIIATVHSSPNVCASAGGTVPVADCALCCRERRPVTAARRLAAPCAAFAGVRAAARTAAETVADRDGLGWGVACSGCALEGRVRGAESAYDPCAPRPPSPRSSTNGLCSGCSLAGTCTGLLPWPRTSPPPQRAPMP